MTSLLSVASRRCADPRTAFADPFGKYKPEDKQLVRLPDIQITPGVQRIIACWENMAHDWEFSLSPLKAVATRLKNDDYSAKDIEIFSIMLSGYQGRYDVQNKAGYFLSALMNNSKADDFLIHTRHLDAAPGYLGYHNTKEIDVDGDVGFDCGSDMTAGRITVNGNAGRYLGNQMEGGLIIVRGSARDFVGNHMRGGEIHVEEDWQGISNIIFKGRIYHRGKLIFNAVDHKGENK